jgi:hypothetical protein
LTPEESNVKAELPIKAFELPFDTLKPIEKLKEGLVFFPDTKFPAHPVKWSDHLYTSTVAHFGQILHPYQSMNPTPLLSDLLASTDRRVFSPTAPHPVQFANVESDSTSSTLINMKSTLLLRFWPSPSSNPATKPGKKLSDHTADTPPAPILELRLATNDREVRGIESLRAIKQTHHTDVMLPSSLVDVRFTQTQYATLEARDSETLAAWQPLADFLYSARLDLEVGKLEMPPRQRFSVPRRLFTTSFSSPSSPADLSSSTASSPGEPAALDDTDNNSSDQQHQQQGEQQPMASDDDLVSVSYEFVGLELHRSASLPYESHWVTYTSIEAGQGGGRRAEVTLEPLGPTRYNNIPLSSPEVVDKAGIQENFLACCSRLVADRSLWCGLVGNTPKS